MVELFHHCDFIRVEESLINMTTKRINLDNDVKTKKKEKHLTVKPYRHQLEECKSSLKQRLKVDHQTSEEDVTALTSQAGGHGAGEEGKAGLLVSGQDHVLKPVQSPPRGPREIAFYEKISTSNDPECQKWRDLAPHFFGFETVYKEDRTSSQYLVLGNQNVKLLLKLTISFRKFNQRYGKALCDGH